MSITQINHDLFVKKIVEENKELRSALVEVMDYNYDNYYNLFSLRGEPPTHSSRLWALYDRIKSDWNR